MQPPENKSQMEFSSLNWDKSTVRSETDASTTSSLPAATWAFTNQANSASLGNLTVSASSQNYTPCRYSIFYYKNNLCIAGNNS